MKKTVEKKSVDKTEKKSKDKVEKKINVASEVANIAKIII